MAQRQACIIGALAEGPDWIEVELLGRDVLIRLLGSFGLTNFGNRRPQVQFRSKTAERLLSLLCLRPSQSVSKLEISESLWPESDGDRQAQNLRRAVSDVRKVLESDSSEPFILLSKGDKIWLDSDRLITDVQLFKRFTDLGLDGIGTEQNLRKAVDLYVGCLLPGESHPWVTVHRQELEERFAQSIDQLIALLLQEGRQEEALRLGSTAVTAAPLREDVHVALMSAYGSAGLRSQAIRQFEELETLLNDEWGEQPSERSLKALAEIDQGDTRTPELRKRIAQETPGGAMPASSPFYIERECDKELRQALDDSEGTLLIHGPRQVGKTSLLYRVLSEVRNSGHIVAVTDFQVLNEVQMASADSFCKSLAHGFASQCGVKLNLADEWNEWIGPNANLDSVVETVLSNVNGPVIWVMDEADRLFGRDFADDFFGLVRSWHNRRSLGGPFGKLVLAIAYATEAHLFIRDIRQSPFNVGRRIPIRDFNLFETRELALRYGVKLTDSDCVTIVEVTGGQPFLTRKALDAIVHRGMSIEMLRISSSRDDGPFAAHLQRLLEVATVDELTQDEVGRFLKGEAFVDPKTSQRLIAGGLLVWGLDGRFEFRVPAYREILSRHLLGR